MIRITSKVAGFRRAGVAHPAAAVDYSDGCFTKAQLDQLEAEPNLTVSYLEGEPETNAGGDPGDVRELIDTIDSLDTQLVELGKKAAGLADDLKARDGQVLQLQGQVEQLTGQLTAVKADLAQRDVIIGERDAMIRGLADEVKAAVKAAKAKGGGQAQTS